MSIVIFYFIFFGVFKFIRWTENRLLGGIILIFFLCNIYCIIVHLIGMGVWWYYSSWAFPLGMISKEYGSIIYRVLNLNNWMYIFIVSCLFIFCYATRFINSKYIHSEFIYIICALFASSLFACLIINISKSISIQSKIWGYIGSISMEIYLIHELIFTILRSSLFYIKSDAIFIIATLIISILSAYILHQVNKKIITIVKI